MRKGEAVVGLENHTKSVEKELFVFILCNWQLQLLVCLGFFSTFGGFYFGKISNYVCSQKVSGKKKKSL